MIRTMGLDLGDTTIGVALSDGLGLTAQGLTTLVRKGGQGDVASLAELCREHEVARLVVGLPRNMNGSEGPRAEKSRRFATELRAALELPVFLWDERLSSAEAERVLISANVSRKRRAEVIDKLAAQLFLQSFLDAGSPETDPA
jgi:putative holliday junction resolvase